MTFEEWEQTPVQDWAERDFNLLRFCWDAAYRAGLERAAEICGEHENDLHDDGSVEEAAGAGSCARRIRAELEGK